VSIGTAGCGDQQSETSPTDTPETAQAGDIGQTISTDDLTLTLTEAVSDSGKDVQWAVVADSADLAQCSVDFSSPETLTQRTAASFAITMENTGNRQARCYRRYQVSGEIERDSYTVFRNLSPGETYETSFSVTPPGIGEFVVETNGETVVDTTVQPPTHEFGESWTSPQGLRITVGNVQFAQEASYERQWEDEIATVEAANDSKFAFFFIEARNVGNNEALDPPHRLVGIRAEVGDTVSEFYEVDNDIPYTWTAPVDGNSYKPGRLGREIAEERDISLSAVFRDYVDTLVAHDGQVTVAPDHEIEAARAEESNSESFPPKVEVPKSFVREHERLELEAEHLREQLEEHKQYVTKLRTRLDEMDQDEVIHLEDLDEGEDEDSSYRIGSFDDDL